MRILFINRMASMERGGGETFDLEIARHLQHLGCDISFLSGIPVLSGAKIQDPYSGFRSPVSGFSLRSPYTAWFPWDKVKGGWRLRLADFWVFEQLACKWALKRQDDYDIIQVCELPAFVCEWKKRGGRTPVVIRLTAPNYVDPGGALKLADGVIASGESVENIRAEVRPDCADIPNAVDTERFRPQPSDFRARVGIDEDAFVVLYVARFQDFKNHWMLLDAFRKVADKLPHARLVLVGSGPLEKRSKKRAEELGLTSRVLFLGEVEFNDLPAIYASADLKVVSSDFESFCFAALEAMATGLPIVTTDCGWVPRLISQGKGGVIVPVGDAAAFGAAIIDLEGSSARRKEMGGHNRQKAVAEHGWGSSAARLLSVYQEVSGKR